MLEKDFDFENPIQCLEEYIFGHFSTGIQHENYYRKINTAELAKQTLEYDCFQSP